MRPAPLLLIALIGLCSCAARPVPPQVTVVPAMSHCPAPHRPALPLLRSELPFDHPANITALMERDDILRGYVHGLESCVRCYQQQTESNNGHQR